MDTKKKDENIISYSHQLNLFEIITSIKDDFSNTIEIYDTLPKYVLNKTPETTDLSTAVITRECKIRNTEFILKITPAIIEKEGKTVLMYPQQREEIIEDVLRKFAASGNGIIIGGKQIGVTFTFYELMRELKRIGHTYNLNEIKESIMICRNVEIKCITKNGENIVSSSIFPTIALTTKEDNRKSSGTTKNYVQFNPLVTESINNLTFRPYNYSIGMTIRSSLARFIYKRMSHYWIQANENNAYNPSLISFLKQSPRGLSSRMSENVRAMKNALEVLIKSNIILNYSEEQIKNGRKLIDIRYSIYPHPDFIQQSKMANHIVRETRNKAKEKKLDIKYKTRD